MQMVLLFCFPIVLNIDNMRQLQKEYDELTDPVSKENKLSEIKNLNIQSKPAFDQESVADYLEIQSIKSDLATVNCPEYIIQVIKDAWTVYLNELNRDFLDTNPRLASNINTISSLCSDEYGDAVHLARSIALIQGSDTYYDTSDGCQDITYSGPRSNDERSHEILLNIYPNPSIGNVQIEFNSNVSGLFQIFNTNGEQVWFSEIKNSAQLSIEIENSGIFIGRFTSGMGDILTKKIIIIK
jgi:hypothetical protein